MTDRFTIPDYFALHYGDDMDEAETRIDDKHAIGYPSMDGLSQI
jgi:hypothetical protein